MAAISALVAVAVIMLGGIGFVRYRRAYQPGRGWPPWVVMLVAVLAALAIVALGLWDATKVR